MDKQDEYKQLIYDYAEAFTSEAGKRVLNHLKKICYCGVSMIPTDRNGQTDPYAVMRNEGKRSVIVHIEMMLNKDPDENKELVNERR